MSRSIRKETSSLAFGIVGRFGESSAGFMVAALNAASAASREVVVLRVLSAGILSSPKGFTFLNANWTTVTMKWITLGSGPGGSHPIRCKSALALKADVGASSRHVAQVPLEDSRVGRARWRHATCHFRRSRTRSRKPTRARLDCPQKIHHPVCPSGSSFVLDCANDRREDGTASASGDRL
jgi:hypothetical protein